MADTDPGLPSREELYGIVRRQFEHEDQILNQRVIWFVFSQSFLFTGYAIGINAPDRIGIPWAFVMQASLCWILPIAAFVSGLVAYVAVVASLLAMRDLRRLYDAFKGRPSSGRELHYPPIEGAPLTRRLTSASALGLPLVFILTWAVLLLRQWAARP